MKEFRDLVRIEKAGFWWWDAFARNRGDLLGDGETFGHAPPQKLKKRMQDREPVVAGPPVVVAGVFEMLKKPQNTVEAERVECNLRESTRHIGRDEGEKEPQGIPVGLDGARPK